MTEERFSQKRFAARSAERDKKLTPLSPAQLRKLAAFAELRRGNDTTIHIGISALNSALGVSFESEEWKELLCDAGGQLDGVQMRITVHRLQGAAKAATSANHQIRPTLSVAKARLLREKKDPALTDGVMLPGQKEFSKGYLEQNLGADWQEQLAGLFKKSPVALPSGEDVYNITMSGVADIMRGNGVKH